MKSGSHPGMRGFSLIEVMVAATVFSLGLGGLSALLLTAVGGTISARNESTAAIHAESLAEMIAMTPGNLDHYVNPVTGNLDAAGMATRNLRFWQMRVAADLPRAKGLVCRDDTPDDGQAADPACDGGDDLVVKVFWLETRQLNDGDGGLKRLTHRVSYP